MSASRVSGRGAGVPRGHPPGWGMPPRTTRQAVRGQGRGVPGWRGAPARGRRTWGGWGGAITHPPRPRPADVPPDSAPPPRAPATPRPRCIPSPLPRLPPLPLPPLPPCPRSPPGARAAAAGAPGPWRPGQPAAAPGAGRAQPRSLRPWPDRPARPRPERPCRRPAPTAPGAATGPRFSGGPLRCGGGGPGRSALAGEGIWGACAGLCRGWLGPTVAYL